MDVTVIVVCFRPGPWLRPALESAVAQGGQVILVDNGAPGQEAARVGRAVGTEVLVSQRNVGFAGGVNLALPRVRTSLVALLNDDAVAAPDWVSSALLAMDSTGADIVGPKLLLAPRYAEVRLPEEPWCSPGDPRSLGRCLYDARVGGRDVLRDLIGGVHRLERGEQQGRHRRWRWTTATQPVYVPVEGDDDLIVFNGEEVPASRIVRLVNNAGSYLSGEGHVGDHGYEAPDDGQFDDARAVFSVCGAALVARHDVFDRIGSFAGRYFAYYEDADWCWRARLAGVEVLYDPTAVVEHARGATSGGEGDRTVRALASTNRLSTLYRNAPLPVARRQLDIVRNDPDRRLEPRRAQLTALRATAERAGLRRRWKLRPEVVWERWAGVGETWPTTSVTGRSGTDVVPPTLRFAE